MGGRVQLRWFQQKLEAAKKQGLFRIGVVHHNVQRGAAADDENLRDADRLDQFLGSSLNLLLHGHTHNSKIGWMNPHLPVLSTGSAALTKDARPEEVPNQYQIIRIWPDRLGAGPAASTSGRLVGKATRVARNMAIPGRSSTRSRSRRLMPLFRCLFHPRHLGQSPTSGTKAGT